MEKLLASIDTRLNYITNNSKNAFILKRVQIISRKMDDVKNMVYGMNEIKPACDKIIDYDISMMQRVAGETNMVYKKMQELADFVAQIPNLYEKNEEE